MSDMKDAIKLLKSEIDAARKALQEESEKLLYHRQQIGKLQDSMRLLQKKIEDNTEAVNKLRNQRVNDAF